MWRYYTIAAKRHGGIVSVIPAPNLAEAFSLARARFGSDSLFCLGSTKEPRS